MWIHFPDAAQFADIARNLLYGLAYGSKMTFWGWNVFETVKSHVFPSPWVPPVMPISIAGSFKLFGVNDVAVIATSAFYFLLLLVFAFLLSKKIFNSTLVGMLSVIAVAFNQSLISYALNGASEMPLMFEIISASYFIYLKKKWGTVISFALMVLMYFTRPQAFIYICGLLLFYLLSRFNLKKAILLFLGSLVAGLLIDSYILSPLAGQYFTYPLLGRGISTFNQAVTTDSTSVFLRGETPVYPVFQIAKKVFYNLYNFYKLLPEIMSPYMVAFFIIGIVFLDRKDKTKNAFTVSSIFMVVTTFLVTAVTIPLFRYIHPVIPLVYIFAVGALVRVVRTVTTNRRLISTLSLTLLLFFCVGQTLGVWLLDSRAIAKSINRDQPPVYVTLSRILKDNTNSDNVVITNLNSWGSWYGDRKTVWYPLEPNMIIPPNEGENNFDAIYLTSYLMDDQNSYMGEEWRRIFDNPTDIQNDYISKHYKLKGIYQVNAADNYENIEAKSVLLIKK